MGRLAWVMHLIKGSPRHLQSCLGLAALDVSDIFAVKLLVLEAGKGSPDTWHLSERAVTRAQKLARLGCRLQQVALRRSCAVLRAQYALQREPVAKTEGAHLERHWPSTACTSC